MIFVYFFFTKKKKYYCYCYAMQQLLPPVFMKESPWIAQISIDFSYTTTEATHSRFWWHSILVDDSMHQTSLSGPKDKRKKCHHNDFFKRENEGKVIKHSFRAHIRLQFWGWNFRDFMTASVPAFTTWHKVERLDVQLLIASTLEVNDVHSSAS